MHYITPSKADKICTLHSWHTRAGQLLRAYNIQQNCCFNEASAQLFLLIFTTPIQQCRMYMLIWINMLISSRSTMTHTRHLHPYMPEKIYACIMTHDSGFQSKQAGYTSFGWTCWYHQGVPWHAYKTIASLYAIGNVCMYDDTWLDSNNIKPHVPPAQIISSVGTFQSLMRTQCRCSVPYIKCGYRFET